MSPEEPFRECIAVLQGLGYRFQTLEGAPLVGTPESLERSAPANALLNVVALPA